MAHDTQAMIDGVWDKLVAVTSDGTFYDDLGGRIYVDEAPDDAALPLAIITLVVDVPDEFFGGEDIDALFDISVFGSKEDGMRTTQASVKTLLALLDDATDISISGFNGVSIKATDRGIRLWDDNRPQIVTSWAITATAN